MLPFDQFRHKFNTEPFYTRREMQEALAAQAKSLVVNRVVRSPNGKWDDACEALQIVHVHHTPEGVMIVVR